MPQYGYFLRCVRRDKWFDNLPRGEGKPAIPTAGYFADCLRIVAAVLAHCSHKPQTTDVKRCHTNIVDTNNVMVSDKPARRTQSLTFSMSCEVSKHVTVNVAFNKQRAESGVVDSRQLVVLKNDQRRWPA